MAATADTTTTGETRLSLVLAGGSSLAIYMNGVSQELLNIVRASADPAASTPVVEAYREALAASEQGPHHRVVVDIFSGTSAGGINALFLAKALVHGVDVQPLADLWIQEGDFVRLMNDHGRLVETHERDLPDLEGVLSKTPKSLLSGDVMYLRLVKALEALDDEASQARGPLVDAVDCYLTTTDLRGQPTQVAIENRIASEPADELQLRSRFRFRHGTEAAMGKDHADLGPELRILQAFAARATSAHPAAFHPAQWNQATRLLDRDEYGEAISRLGKKLPAHLEPNDTGGLTERWYSDGGDIDNKPFSYALEPLRTRRADVPVSRKVVFVEPDPSRPSPATYLDNELPALWTYTGGAYGLGRMETIRQDLDDIRERNEAVERLTTATGALFGRDAEAVLASLRRGVTDALGEDVSTSVTRALEAPATAVDVALGDELQGQMNERWEDEDDLDAADAAWSTLRAFEQFRHRSVMQYYAALAKRLWDRREAQRAASEASASGSDTAAPPALPTENDWLDAISGFLRSDARPTRSFLRTHDIGFRLRRLSFAEHLLSWWQREHPADFEAARELRRRLNALFLELRKLVDELNEDADLTPDGRSTADIEAYLAGLEARLQETMAAVSAKSRQVIRQAAGGEASSLRLALAEVWVNYATYDQLVLPVWEVAQGEINTIGVVRISPFDATGLLDETKDVVVDDREKRSRRRKDREEKPRLRAKLGGATLGHFGAFLDADWRRTDILWGRLDAAEVLVSDVLTIEDVDVCGEALRKVQLAILEEYAARTGPDGVPAPDLRALLRVDAGPKAPAHEAARAALEGLDQTSGSSRRSVAAAFYDLLASTWTVDHSAAGDRAKRKAEVVVQASRLVGTMLRHSKTDPWAEGSGSKVGGGLPSRGAGLVGRAVGGIVDGAYAEGLYPRIWGRVIPLAAVAGGVQLGRRSRSDDPASFWLAMGSWALMGSGTIVLGNFDNKLLARILVSAGTLTGLGAVQKDVPSGVLGLVAPAVVGVGAGTAYGLPKLKKFLTDVGQEDS